MASLIFSQSHGSIEKKKDTQTKLFKGFSRYYSHCFFCGFKYVFPASSLPNLNQDISAQSAETKIKI